MVINLCNFRKYSTLNQYYGTYSGNSSIVVTTFTFWMKVKSKKIVDYANARRFFMEYVLISSRQNYYFFLIKKK